MDDRLRHAYFARLVSGGKGLPARALDYVLFRALLYLLFLLMFLTHPLRFIIAGTMLLAACILLALLRKLRRGRIEKHELERIGARLFRDRILQMPTDELRQLLEEEGAAADGLIILRRHDPVAVDDLLSHTDRTDSQIRLLVTSTYAAHTVENMKHLMPNVALFDIVWLQSVLAQRVVVTEEMIDCEIRRMESARRARGKHPPRLPEGSEAAGKYLLLGILLLTLSFAASHPIYYRLLSSMALFAAGMQITTLMIRKRKGTAPPNDGAV